MIDSAFDLRSRCIPSARCTLEDAQKRSRQTRLAQKRKLSAVRFPSRLSLNPFL